MTRRQFMRNFLITFQGLAMMSLTPKTLFATASGDSGITAPHYRPLNGRSLRDIVQEKMHHNSDGFVNPLGMNREGRFWEVMKWKFFHSNQFKEFFDEERVIPVSIDWEPVRQHQGCSITYVKHAAVMIKDEDDYILVDPVFSDIFWFIKDFSPLEFDLQTMPTPRHVLITHGHYDHLDKSSLASLNKGTHVISPLGYDSIFRDLAMNNRTQLDWFDSHADGKREIISLPCNHWTMRNPLTGPNRSLWGSYLIKTSGGHTIYLSGDTAYFDGFEQLGTEFNIDLAIFNVGAYEPRWFMAPSHMNPRETVQAFKELNARKLLIVHWGTFRLGDEPVHFPPIQVKEELKKEGLLDRWVDLKHGETLFL
jgi:N-acyl-phosphatidylethanolamine-hydrolysing phospholipase D